ncbi:SRPBCC family protein [Luteipulveratus sp. YIM 133132]|uniref:SRPBCC family protein n=1 Tax=Luteipulveratus flavus TaxID=3031728 RepID=UPI0023AF516A|nr:SRPBCC family protein [Luteipulveratus sp. YIM 133132]MDE9365337.1 SRPBCC family protein [Luteipulveratus sp. YIM 133132]
MAQVSRTFLVDCPAPRALAYLADFANATEWDPGTVACEPLTEPPVRVGSRWHNTSKVLGRTTELEYTLTTVEGERVVLDGRNDGSTTQDDLTARPAAGDRAEITYRATITLTKGGAVGDLGTRLLLQYLAKKTVRQMTTVLAQHGGRA